MTSDEVVKRLKATSAYVSRQSEEVLRELGVTVDESLGSQSRKPDFEGELNALLARYEDGLSTASDLRRVAELVELLEGEESSLLWWSRAAQAGNFEAIEVVKDMQGNLPEN